MPAQRYADPRREPPLQKGHRPIDPMVREVETGANFFGVP